MNMQRLSRGLCFVSLSLCVVGCGSAPESSESLEEDVRSVRCEPSFQAFARNSLLFAVSGNGSTAVGGFGLQNEPFLYDGDFTFLPVPEGAFSAVAIDISADASVVAGYGFGFTTEAVTWRGDTITRLGALNPLQTYSVTEGMSSDGKVVVGYSRIDPARIEVTAFRWDAKNGMVDLGVGGLDSRAMAADRHGKVVIGNVWDGTTNQGFVWTHNQGVTLLGVPDGYVSSQVFGVSGDGKVVVGSLDDGSDFPSTFPARWTEKNGWELIDAAEGGAGSATRDGSIIAGGRLGPIGGPFTAMLWDEERGPLVVADLLTEAGVSFGDLQLQSVDDISDDGKVIVGTAYDDGFLQGFMACLP
jgi:probable HAF family extracellular repeat protein